MRSVNFAVLLFGLLILGALLIAVAASRSQTGSAVSGDFTFSGCADSASAFEKAIQQ
jgi:hypothetical protein